MKLARLLPFCFSLALIPSQAPSQEYDLFSRQAAVSHVGTLAMIWLGAAQGIVENCGGDVSRLGQKFVNFIDNVTYSSSRELAMAYAGTFGEGIQMGRGYGCNIDKLALFESNALFYLEPAMQSYKN
jgi:hypothetical protein